jgi:hypothetical protein
VGDIDLHDGAGGFQGRIGVILAAHLRLDTARQQVGEDRSLTRGSSLL